MAHMLQQIDVAPSGPANYGAPMRAKRTLQVTAPPKARVAAALALVIYSFVAVLCIGGQLPFFGKCVGHDAPEVIHLKVDNGAGDLGHIVRKCVMDPPHAAASADEGSGSNTALIKTNFEVGHAGLAVAFPARTPTGGPSIHPDGWAHVWLATTRWYRTVVLLI